MKSSLLSKILFLFIAFLSFMFFLIMDYNKVNSKISNYKYLIPSDVRMLSIEDLKNNFSDGEELKHQLNLLKSKSSIGEWGITPLFKNGTYYCVVSFGESENNVAMLHEFAHCNLAREMVDDPDGLLLSINIVDKTKPYFKDADFMGFLSVHVNEVYADIVGLINYYIIYNDYSIINNVIEKRLYSLCEKSDLLHYSSPYLYFLMYSIENKEIDKESVSNHYAENTISNIIDIDFIYDSYKKSKNNHRSSICN